MACEVDDEEDDGGATCVSRMLVQIQEHMGTRLTNSCYSPLTKKNSHSDAKFVSNFSE
jgi:hypothetical protein